jgi:RNA 2',3'-cyclic 3'-phosphodiesterase
MRTRAFLAIPLADEIAAAATLVARRLAGADRGVNWLDEEQIHLTVQFLGEISDYEIGEVCLRLGRLTQTIEPFMIGVNGIGAFPNLQKPRAIWFGVTEGREELLELVAAVEKSLASLGFRGEGHRFTPHVTIGRVNGQSNQLTEGLNRLIGQRAGQSHVDEIILYASELAPSGPEYTVLGRFPLGEEMSGDQ